MDRQRLLLIFGGAWIAAALLVWFLYAQTQTPKTEKTLSCVAVTHDLPAGTRLKKSDIRLVRLPEKSLPRTAVLDEASALDRVLLFPVNANETLTTSRLTSSKGAEQRNRTRQWSQSWSGWPQCRKRRRDYRWPGNAVWSRYNRWRGGC